MTLDTQNQDCHFGKWAKTVKNVLFIVTLCSATTSAANNLAISNPTLTAVDDSEGFAIISFDVSWENSWRDAENWDAVWVFLKYNNGSSWHHAELNYQDGFEDGHSSPAGSIVQTPSDGKGIFLYRSAEGAGNNSFVGIQIRWNYQADGLSSLENVELAISGIEMVYVPPGNFWLGDGSLSNIQGQFEDGASGSPLQITSENELLLGGGATGSLGNNNGQGMSNNGDGIPTPYNSLSMDDFNDTQSQVLPAAFPKGHQGFYCMKYELTYQQYVDFLNLLNPAQVATRYSPDPNATLDISQFRYEIEGTHPNFITQAPHVGAVFIEYYDGAAYADWAGLRPMTELEFEKACRGFETPLAGEYAWGTNSINASPMTISDLNAPNEGVSSGYSTTVGNAWYDPTSSTLNQTIRAGIFAANPLNDGRVTAGATYWGIMDMSGSNWERAITVGRPEGRAFEGSHGDGELNELGNATNSDWPGHSGADGVDDVIGGGYRGGGFGFPNPVVSNLRVSARRMATSFYNIRYYDDTMRFVRTAP